MKLIPAFCTKNVVALSMLLTIVTASHARVFWNKVEATVANGSYVTLTWNVTEYNNNKFYVQHSVDGIKWETLAVIDSKNSPQTMTDYSFSQRSRLSGKQYYRVQDVDIDVTNLSYSPIKSLMLKPDSKGVSFWPNPATDRILVESNDDNNVYTKATVASLAGKIMFERKLTNEVNEIAVSQLSPGIYILKLETEKGSATSQKFIKR